ncbi:alpha/beta fold hydrolase [Ideonella sp. 4Y11]|uniref:Alpha/beta fold hydrolase n=1 Tax=Ideonella aquatica TaxID=2824119 RepID=A0A940YU82_9BURK|nr:alpha/beta hydrolase [Ideonella aquatica]MBQ0959395.1 alpha/beta fold hydrolase [Ideonella aquatica]
MQISAHGVAIEVDDQGPMSGPVVLLIQGLGMQLTDWPQALVDDLVGRGHRVLRFDNRDAGLSQGFDATALAAGLAYTLSDMVQDALGVLDALGVARAHVVGASMGGMIAQRLAAAHPGRVASLTLVMTTAGARGLPAPTPQALATLSARPEGSAIDQLAQHMVRSFGVLGSPAYAPEPPAFMAHWQRQVQRAWRPQGTARQMAAVMADGDRTPLLARITAPVHIIHGDADPLVPVAAAEHLARHLPGSTLDIIPGMGHDFPLPLMPRWAAGIAANAARPGAAR